MFEKSLGGEITVAKYSSKSFLVGGCQVYTHLRRYFGPLVFTEARPLHELLENPSMTHIQCSG